MTGGTPIVIAPAPGNATATWMEDDTIVFATNTDRVLQRVPVSGGPVESLTVLDAERGDTLHLLPQAVPGGRYVLYTIVSGATRQFALLDLDTRDTEVLTTGSHGRYLGSAHLVYWRDGSLWGVRFDLASRRLEEAAVPLVSGVAHSDNTVLHFDASAAGTLVYLVAPDETFTRQLVWVDRTGVETPVTLEPQPFSRVSLAPDGGRLAVAIDDGSNSDIWIGDLARGTLSRLTVDPTIETMPIWSPDGQWVAFRSEREGPGIFRRDAQGAGPIERLTKTDGPIHSPYSWTPDGRTLLLAVFRSFRHQAIARVTPPDTEVEVLLDGDFAQLDPQVSPDGRWLAYQSDETGRFEVYVRPSPDVQGGRWQVSVSGGTSPRWSGDGRELFYYYYDGTAIMASAIGAGSTFAARRPERLFDTDGLAGRLGLAYAVSPNGRRFLVLNPTPAGRRPPAELVVVQHWSSELRARLSGAP